jgi:Tfp pilus assembly protein PilP
LNQFRIVGIVWIGGKPQAMIVDPEANTYFLGVGDKIGSSDGEILEVRQNGILVQERTKLENVYGEVKIEVKQSVLAYQNDE